MGFVDLEKSYNLFMNTYSWGGAEKNNVYFDEKNRQMLISYRINVARIADELSARGRQAEAVKILDKVMAGISEDSYPYDMPSYFMAVSYYKAAALEKGRKLTMAITRNMEDDVKYILSFNDEDTRNAMATDVQRDLSVINYLSGVAGQAGDQKTSEELGQKVQILAQQASTKINMQQMQ